MESTKVLEYDVFFEEDKVLGGFIAIVPALPGCVSEGKTLEDAKKSISEAILLYLESMAKEGEIVDTTNIGHIEKVSIPIDEKLLVNDEGEEYGNN